MGPARPPARPLDGRLLLARPLYYVVGLWLCCVAVPDLCVVVVLMVKEGGRTGSEGRSRREAREPILGVLCGATTIFALYTVRSHVLLTFRGSLMSIEH